MFLFDRTVSVRFPGALRDISGHISYVRDQGPRIAFDFARGIRAEPDRGMLRIWNLPKEVTDRIVSDHAQFQQFLKKTQTAPRQTDQQRAERLYSILEQHIVEVWAGYGTDSSMIFRGDVISVRPRVRDGLDYVCEIELGDGFVALQEQWMAQVFGVGETPANLFGFLGALATAGSDDQAIRTSIGLVSPNAITARLNNQWVGQGRPADAIKEISDFLGLYWWVKDGKIEFIARDSYLPDFAVELNANSTLYATGETDDGRYRAFDCVLTPLVHPGRAVRIIDENGARFQGRILETKISGDTHADEWHITGLCDASTWQALPMVEAHTGPRLKITAQEWEKQTTPPKVRR